MKLLRSELTKLTSTPTNVWLVVIYCLISALLGFAIAHFMGTGGPFGGGQIGRGPQISLVIRAGNISGIVFALGVLLVAAEERHGMLSQTFVNSSACRRCVMGAKALVAMLAAVIAALGGMLTSVMGAGLSTLINSDTSLSVGGNLGRSVLGVMAISVFYALIGLGLGAAMRPASLAIAAGLVWIMAADGILTTFVPSINRILLSRATSDMLQLGFSSGLSGDPSSPWIGAAVFSCWAAVLLVVGTVLLERRDLTD